MPDNVNAKIIVVDDEKDICELIGEVLRREGYDVLTFIDPKRAIEEIMQNGCDLVITDIMMPDITGMELLKQIKEEADKDIEVIVITAFADIDTAITALREGAYDYVKKPFNVGDDLLSVVKRAIEKKELLVENKRLLKELSAANEELKYTNKKLRRSIAQNSTLYQISQIIGSKSNVSDILKLAIDGLTLTLGVEVCSVMLKADNQEFVIKRAHNLSDETINKFKISYQSDILNPALKSGQLVLVENFRQDETYKSGFGVEDKNKINMFLSVPMKAAGNIIGVLTIHKLREDCILDEDLKNLYSIVASQISAPIKLLI